MTAVEIVTPDEDAATVRTAMHGQDGPRTVLATATGTPTAIERRASTATHAARRAGRNDSIDPSAPTVTPVHPARRAGREVRGATTGVSTIARRGGKIATAMKHAGVTR